MVPKFLLDLPRAFWAGVAFMGFVHFISKAIESMDGRIARSIIATEIGRITHVLDLPYKAGPDFYQEFEPQIKKAFERLSDKIRIAYQHEYEARISESDWVWNRANNRRVAVWRYRRFAWAVREYRMKSPPPSTFLRDSLSLVKPA